MASHPTQPNEQRRRLLKAASAAPVIFTLPVGSSVAAGSVQCDLIEGNTRIESGNYTLGDTVTISDQKYYVAYELPNDNYELVTSSCWTSLNPTIASASSSKHIV